MALGVCLPSSNLYLIFCTYNRRLPLGVPHRVNQDDWYNGMLIPKDSTVLIPIWAMHFTEKFGYKNPDMYNPDRFLNYPRLASEYAGASDFMNRDKSSLPGSVCFAVKLTAFYITLGTELVVASAQACIWQSGLNGESLLSCSGHSISSGR